jgi:hypothetical protein
MCDEILLHYLFKNLVAEMLTSITYDCLRSTKARKNSLLGTGPQLCGHWSCMQQPPPIWTVLKYSDANQGAGHADHTRGNGAEVAQDPL